ncbi:MAG: NAD(P)H-hydrate dehydratase, partial [Actinomycetota bacterium]
MGRVLVVAGSRGMAGAAALCAQAAMRSGCGYVYVATVGAISPELTAAVPSAILR